MIDEMLAQADHKMQQAIEAFRKELQTIRTGRASPSLIEHVHIEYYGSTMPLFQMASITAPDPRQLLIKPHDRQTIGPIEKGIQKSDLGLNPVNDGTAIRITIPPLTEERRKDMVKMVHKRVEECKVAVRNGRRDAHEHLKALEKDKKASTDEVKRAQDRLQKLTDKMIAQVDSVGQDKERDIMTV